MTTIPKAPPWACGPRAQRDPQPLDALVGRVESSGESSRVAAAPFRRTPGVSSPPCPGPLALALIASLALIGLLVGCGTPVKRTDGMVDTPKLTYRDLEGMAAEMSDQLKDWGGLRRKATEHDRRKAQVAWEPPVNETGQEGVVVALEDYLAPQLQSEVVLLAAYGWNPSSKEAQKWVLWDNRDESGTHVPESLKPDFFLKIRLYKQEYPGGAGRLQTEYRLDVDVVDAAGRVARELSPITRTKP